MSFAAGETDITQKFYAITLACSDQLGSEPCSLSTHNPSSCPNAHCLSLFPTCTLSVTPLGSKGHIREKHRDQEGTFAPHWQWALEQSVWAAVSGCCYGPIPKTTAFWGSSPTPLHSSPLKAGTALGSAHPMWSHQSLHCT